MFGSFLTPVVCRMAYVLFTHRVSDSRYHAFFVLSKTICTRKSLCMLIDNFFFFFVMMFLIFITKIQFQSKSNVLLTNHSPYDLAWIGFTPGYFLFVCLFVLFCFFVVFFVWLFCFCLLFFFFWGGGVTHFSVVSVVLCFVCLRSVFLCLLRPVIPMYLECPFSVAPSVLSNLCTRTEAWSYFNGI